MVSKDMQNKIQHLRDRIDSVRAKQPSQMLQAASATDNHVTIQEDSAIQQSRDVKVRNISSAHPQRRPNGIDTAKKLLREDSKDSLAAK